MTTVPARLTLVDAEIAGTAASTLSIRAARIAALGAPPAPGDVVVELEGARLLPGLINAHDHLQLNVFPRTRFRQRHANVGEWIADVDARRDTDDALAVPGAVPREQRLVHGAVQNLLSGVTTVAHHDPLYPLLESADFPCRVVQRYGWAHSLAVDGAEHVRASYRATPADTPWFVHAGEGVDNGAREEYAELESLGCVGANTLLVHGVAFGEPERADLFVRGAALVWCPSSNLFLFGKTAKVDELLARGRVVLGTDSQLSGAGGLLAEMRVAREHCHASDAALETMVTQDAARLLRMTDRGTLRVGALADLIVVPRGRTLPTLNRAELRCVMLGGQMLWGDADLAAQLMPAARRVAATVDGRDKLIDSGMADALRQQPSQGVQSHSRSGRAA
jgi:cytosine/adenosine deaminase-related metal-dependent hydrolase